jgi:hypothetical protein
MPLWTPSTTDSSASRRARLARAASSACLAAALERRARLLQLAFQRRHLPQLARPIEERGAEEDGGETSGSPGRRATAAMRTW